MSTDATEKQRLIVTKYDLVDNERMARVLLMLRGLNAQAGLQVASHGVVDWSRLLDGAMGARWEATGLPAAPSDSHPGPAVCSFAVGVAISDSHPGPAVCSFAVGVATAVEFGPFAMWLSMMTQLHGTGFLRLKGLLHVKGEPGPVVVQSVQHVVYPTYVLPRWPSKDERSRVVVITRGLEPDMVVAIEASLRAVMGAVSLTNHHHHDHARRPAPAAGEEALR